MANKKLIIAGALLLMLAPIALFLVGISTERYSISQSYVDNSVNNYFFFFGAPPEKYNISENFVTNRTIEHSSGNLIINDVIKYPAKVNMTAFNASDPKIKVGVAAQTYEINFGNVPQNITVRKFIDMKNNEKSPVRLCLSSRGEIAPYINYTQGSSLVLASGEEAKIEVLFNSEKIGLMDGEIDIVVRKPRYDYEGYMIGLVGC